jgi:hypothetical protein
VLTVEQEEWTGDQISSIGACFAPETGNCRSPSHISNHHQATRFSLN